MPIPFNVWSILGSMIISVILGFLWYGPFFGKKWMELSGLKMPDEKPSFKMMLKPILLSFIGAILMSYVLSASIAFGNFYLGTTGICAGLTCAFFMWLGFIVPTYLNLSGWEGRSWTLFFINVGYWLVFLFISASLISWLM